MQIHDIITHSQATKLGTIPTIDELLAIKDQLPADPESEKMYWSSTQANQDGWVKCMMSDGTVIDNSKGSLVSAVII